MKIVLPPKRWERSNDTKYDAIRYKPWFVRAERRKVHIGPLEHSYRLIKENGLSQLEAAKITEVDARELRDFIKLKDKIPGWATCDLLALPRCRKTINSAYALYCDSSAKYSYSKCVEKAAEYWAFEPRAMRELWEVYYDIYPTNYNL